jgi:hypothetical protein
METPVLIDKGTLVSVLRYEDVGAIVDTSYANEQLALRHEEDYLS